MDITISLLKGVATMDDRDFYWDWIKHEGNTFTNRGSFFLVAESMLLVVIATLGVSFSSAKTIPLLTVNLAGIFVTMVWLYVNFRHIFVTMRAIGEKLKSHEARWDEIVKHRRKWPSNNIIMGIVLPGGLLVLWMTLLWCFVEVGHL
jgi:hypothetical protein